MKKMAHKTIGIVLSLKNKYSEGFKSFKDATKATDKDIKRMHNRMKNFGRDANRAFVDFAKKGTMAVGAFGAAAAGLGVKKGLSEAFDMEGYKAQLETATKDTKKASDVMQYAINLANKTPFEGGELVEASAKFESMGMSAKKWLTLTGDMAGATNKSMDQATEAIIDAQTGELERLKEFGIKKADIAKKANEMFAEEEIINAKGQIVNQEKFNEALVALMQDKYKGGMDKLANTTKGMWSTITGVTKSALATMMGMGTDGAVRSGSALDLIRQNVKALSEQFSQWQEDGTIEKWSKKMDKGAAVAVNAIKNAVGAIRWMKNNAGWLIPVLAGVASGIGALKILLKLASWIRMVRAAMQVASAMSFLTPMGLLAVAIGVVIGLLVAVVLHWKKIKAAGKNALNFLIEKFSKFKDFLGQFSVPKWIKRMVDLFKKIASYAKFVIDNVPRIRLPKLPEWPSPKDPKPPRHATGTSYFAGGLTSINEGGRDEMAILPSGTQIIPHEMTKNILGGKTSVGVTVHIHGNVIGNESFADWVGERTAKKIMHAMANI